MANADLDLSLAPPVPRSVLTGVRVVSFYGHPGAPGLGVLGQYASAEAAAAAVEQWAVQYARLSTDRRVVPALHLIVDVAQRDPGNDGSYLSRMPIEAIQPYVEATRERGELLFLDVQVGWGDPLAEVQRLEPLLREAHVHVALDPEYATRGKHDPPGEAIGFLTAEQVNGVQGYLAGLARSAGLPAKVLVLHQFRGDMLVDPASFARVDGVDLLIDMDGWGLPAVKLGGYDAFARAPYAEYSGFKLFFAYDTPLLTPGQVMALPHPPDYVIYQ